MSKQDGTKTAVVATVTQILADLLVLGHDAALPDPVDLHTTAEQHSVNLNLHSYEDLIAWHEALQGPDIARTTIDGLCHRAWIDNRLGWRITLRAVARPYANSAGLPVREVDVLRAVTR